MTTSDNDLLSVAWNWHSAGRKVAIATVVETWGSAPRVVGSLLAMDSDGAMEGSVSGGCVEGAVLVEAMEAIDDGQARLLQYGVSDDDAFAVGLACGGEIKILVEPVGTAMPETLLQQLLDRKASHQPVAYVVDLASSRRHLDEPTSWPERFRFDRSGIENDGVTFVAVHNPPLRMVIVGAVHIAQHLVPMARAVGFAPILVDPRAAFGAEARFPGETILDDWPDRALEGLDLDARTAVVTLTHDPKLDDPALQIALDSDVFYVGCLGSKRTHAKRIERLEKVGFSQEAMSKIKAPVGLNLGGRDPAEIAVCIIAEVVQTLRGPK